MDWSVVQTNGQTEWTVVWLVQLREGQTQQMDGLKDEVNDKKDRVDGWMDKQMDRMVG